ncbi:unnamed protein product, partial [Candidula unifasciata]
VQYVDSDGAYCPRSLYDCNSLESELHSSADLIITPEFMTSSDDDNYIGEICKFFKRAECSDPVLSQCKGEVIYATKAFKLRQQYICGERFTRKGLQSMKTCVHKFNRHFSTCHQKRHTLLEEAAYVTQTTSDSGPWCNLTKDYITCVYSVMALGCTMEVAEEYMETVNQSVPVLEAVFGHRCAFGHPLDLLKTSVPGLESTSSTQNQHEDDYGVGRRFSPVSRRSAAGKHHHSYSLIILILSIRVYCLIQERCIGCVHLAAETTGLIIR